MPPLIQHDLLTKHGCDVIRSEKMSGKSLGGREQLRVLLDFIGKGDVLVVTKLDRLGRNLLDILVVIQEIEAKGAQLVSIASTPRRRWVWRCSRLLACSLSLSVP